MNIALLIILAITAALVALVRLLTPRRSVPRIPALVALIGLVLVVIGIVLTTFAFTRVSHALERQSWPIAEGVVTRSVVTGTNSFAPEIDYQFVVDSVIYTGSSDRHVPFFGNRRRTLEVAEKEAAAFDSGSAVPVYYDPRNPANNTIQPEPRWNDFAQTGLGVFLFAGGLFLVTLPRKKSAATSA